MCACDYGVFDCLTLKNERKVTDMANYNRVILVGHLTRDPVLNYTPQRTPVCDVGVAVNERVRRDEKWVEQPTFVDVTLWGRTAQVAHEYLAKGAPVLIEGRLRLATWEKEGERRSKLKVVCDRMQMLGSRKDAKPAEGDGATDGPPPSANGGGEEIPF